MQEPDLIMSTSPLLNVYRPRSISDDSISYIFILVRCYNHNWCLQSHQLQL